MDATTATSLPLSPSQIQHLIQRNSQGTTGFYPPDQHPAWPSDPNLHLKRKWKELAYLDEEVTAAQKEEDSAKRAATSESAVKLLGYQGDFSTVPAPASAVPSAASLQQQLVTVKPPSSSSSSKPAGAAAAAASSTALAKYNPHSVPTPQWNAPWELSAVISGHLGWVRCIAFDPSNEWFATGSADRTIKIWDLAKCCAGSEGGLKLTLTGHINAVRGLVVSPRHPYLFSAGEDNMVKCWDLEQNKVIRDYHGHLSGVFSLAIHPTLDLLISGGRDSVARVWDIRTKHQIHVLSGHESTVGAIITNSVDPQVITGSYDATIKLWDMAAGRSMATLTHHKKAVRSLVANRRSFTFVSGSADNIKKWKTRDGTFLQNLPGHNTPINALAINDDGVLVSCGDNGTMHFWDYETGYCFQKTATIVQPGSLDAESGIYAAAFDLSGSRLITCEADKSVKIWKENDTASEESHPLDLQGWTREWLALKRY